LEADENGTGKIDFNEFLVWISLKQINKLLDIEKKELDKVKGMKMEERITSTQGNVN